MSNFHRFRRFALLLLSLTLGTQAMAVASFGACHKLAAVAASAHIASASGHQHAASSDLAAAALADGDLAQHGAAAHTAAVPHHPASSDSPVNEGSRVKCAACAGCHLGSVVLIAVNVVADIPAAGSALFPALEMPRVRNVASGLERPPRA